MIRREGYPTSALRLRPVAGRQWRPPGSGKDHGFAASRGGSHPPAATSPPGGSVPCGAGAGDAGVSGDWASPHQLKCAIPKSGLAPAPPAPPIAPGGGSGSIRYKGLWDKVTIRFFVSSGKRWTGDRPRLPWAKAAIPSFLYPAKSLRTCRTDRPISLAASSPVRPAPPGSTPLLVAVPSRSM